MFLNLKKNLAFKATLCWFQPEFHGYLPNVRLGHCSEILKENVLVVFGGYGGPEGHTKYNEINLFHFDTMTWTQPIVHGKIPPPMYAHRTATYFGRIILFGGDFGETHRQLSNNLYIFDLSIIFLNNNYNKSHNI